MGSSFLVPNTYTSAREDQKILARAQRRKRRAYQRVMSGLQQDRPYYFLTLGLGPQYTVKDAQAYWHVVLNRFRRIGMIDQYMRVIESGKKTGSIHLHVLYTGKYIDWEIIRRNWFEVTGRWYAWVKSIRWPKERQSKLRLANYLTKYVTKEDELYCRVSYSQNWIFPQAAAYWHAYKMLYRGNQVPFYLVLKGWQEACAKGVAPGIDLPPTKTQVRRESLSQSSLSSDPTRAATWKSRTMPMPGLQLPDC
jgi:hypothetical protein